MAEAYISTVWPGGSLVWKLKYNQTCVFWQAEVSHLIFCFIVVKLCAIQLVLGYTFTQGYANILISFVLSHLMTSSARPSPLACMVGLCVHSVCNVHCTAGLLYDGVQVTTSTTSKLRRIRARTSSSPKSELDKHLTTWTCSTATEFSSSHAGTWHLALARLQLVG